MSAAAEAVLSRLQERLARPLVSYNGKFFLFWVDGRVAYDFAPTDAANCLFWMRQLSEKSWATKEHLGQFAGLACLVYGVEQG